MSVEFRDVHFHREAIIRSEVSLRFEFMIHKSDSQFEVLIEIYAIIKQCKKLIILSKKSEYVINVEL